MMIATTHCRNSPSLKRKLASDHTYSNGDYRSTILLRYPKRRRQNSCVQNNTRSHQSTSPKKGLHTCLTRSAVRKFNKINARSNPTPISLPVVLGSTNTKEADWVVQPVDEFLSSCDRESLEQLQKFASDGGPALLDLRGVSPLSMNLVLSDKKLMIP